MSVITELSNGTTGWLGKKCPFTSSSVVCGNDSCGSENFNLDISLNYPPDITPEIIPGICDDCGYRFGRRSIDDSSPPQKRDF